MTWQCWLFYVIGLGTGWFWGNAPQAHILGQPPVGRDCKRNAAQAPIMLHCTFYQPSG
jgi:hypothetical protein